MDDSLHSGTSNPDESKSPEPKEQDKLAQTEDKAVWYLKLAVILVFVSVALVVCLGVYFGAKKGEEADFEDDFSDLSEKLVDSFQLAFRQRLGILEDFAYELTSFTLDTNTSWPFVTLPDYERRGGRAARLADLLSIMFLPIVHAQDRDQWEKYVPDNMGWTVPIVH